MRNRYSRRRLLAGLGTGVSASLVGCSSFETSDSDGTPDRSIGGRVVGTDGVPISNATVDARDPMDGTQSTVSTGDDGGFGLEVAGPVWLRVRKDGYNNRVKAIRPGDLTRIQLSRSDAVSLAFGGDVMFGRRFYGSKRGDGRPRYRIDETRSLESHRRILSDIEPLLSSADIASVNLESPLTTTNWRHPEKTYTFTSDPIAGQAMADAGIDYAALGNNHAFDALTPGLDDTLETLDGVGIDHSGAGRSSEAAWEPAVVEREGHSVALISCTTIVADRYRVDWSADRDQDAVYTVDGADVSGVDAESRLQVPGSAGVAEPNPERLRGAVIDAATRANTVVVQIHGGEQYRRRPADRIRTLVDAAVDAGADLVVNHHPHVTGGVERREGALVAWSLGNLVFDQEIWSTLQSYVFTVDIDDDGVVHASTEPVVLQGYVPKPATGRTREQLARGTGALSSAPMAYTADGTVTPPSDADSATEVQELSGDGTTFTLTGSLVGADPEENVSLGRDRFLFGRFRNELVTERPTEGPLWRFGRERATVGPGVGYGNLGGIELTRNDVHSGRAFISPRYRIPVAGDPLTLTGLYAFEGRAGFEVLISWYDDTGGASFEQRRIEPSGTDGAWRRFEYDLSPPSNANYVDVFVFLMPPSDGERILRLSDLRLIEWGSGFGPGTDHVSVDGSATVAVETHDDLTLAVEPLVDPTA